MSSPRSDAGYVYFIGHETIGPIKIGASADPYERVRTLRCGSPVWLSVLGTLPVEDMFREERKLHEHFAEVRSHGEWFERTPELLAIVSSRRPTLREPSVPLVEREGIYTLSEAAEILGCSVNRLRMRVKRSGGSIPVQGKRGIAFLYSITDLAAP